MIFVSLSFLLSLLPSALKEVKEVNSKVPSRDALALRARAFRNIPQAHAQLIWLEEVNDRLARSLPARIRFHQVGERPQCRVPDTIVTRVECLREGVEQLYTRS
jgi:hypothetical protein